MSSRRSGVGPTQYPAQVEDDLQQLGEELISTAARMVRWVPKDQGFHDQPGRRPAAGPAARQRPDPDQRPGHGRTLLPADHHQPREAPGGRLAGGPRGRPARRPGLHHPADRAGAGASWPSIRTALGAGLEPYLARLTRVRPPGPAGRHRGDAAPDDDQGTQLVTFRLYDTATRAVRDFDARGARRGVDLPLRADRPGRPAPRPHPQGGGLRRAAPLADLVGLRGDGDRQRHRHRRQDPGQVARPRACRGSPTPTATSASCTPRTPPWAARRPPTSRGRPGTCPRCSS